MADATTKPGDRKTQMIEAAIESLKEVGYAGTSIREIARRGGFNSALISYYFGGLHGLLLAALDYSSETRMRRYTRAVEEAAGFEELVEVARRIYREDLEGGHITVFSEMVAASLAHRELAPELLARSEPWLDFVQGAIEKVAGDNPLLGLLPARDIAYSVLCFYVGVNLMTQLDRDGSRNESLFELAGGMAPALAPLLGKT
ncbi:MAG: TetR family transcriptional regulator [Actinomycetota bacterium]|nr:TetR family transcriptional regulator [Actinomycetota bacterium]